MEAPHTLWHTSIKSSAIKSLILLWCIVRNPPVGQFSAWSASKGFPHTHWEGRFKGCHSYLKNRASRKSPLCRQNPWYSLGSATSRLKDPFSLAIEAMIDGLGIFRPPNHAGRENKLLSKIVDCQLPSNCWYEFVSGGIFQPLE